MQPSNLAKRAWFFLFLAIGAFYLYGLGSVPLIGPDEPRYAEVAREMLARHDLITPTLGGLPWFEKPPLLYWMMMASYRVFGVNEFAARLGPALCGLLTGVFVYWIGAACIARITSTTITEGSWGDGQASQNDLARWSALALLSSISVIALSRAASFDVVVTMTLTGALACFFTWEVRYRTARGSARVSDSYDSDARPARMPALLFGFYFFIALSLLAKGLIGIVIPFGVIAFYFLLRREWPSRAFSKSLLWGIPLTIGIAALWYGPMIARHGWTFIDQFIIQQHIARFLTNKYHHPQPFYFYLLTLTWLALPWTIFLVDAFVSSRSWNWRGETSVDRLRVFTLAWIVVPLIFFSFSESKLAAYILPVVPAAALLVGERMARLLRAKRGEKVIRLTGILLLILAGAGVWYLIRTFGTSTSCAIGITLVAIVAGLLAVFAPGMRRAALLLFFLSTLAASAVALHCAAPIVAQRESVRDLLGVATERGYGATPVVQLLTIQRTAEFYAAGRLTYRPDGEPKMLETVSELVDAAHQNGVVVCFVPKEYESQLLAYHGLESKELANNGSVALLVVRSR